MTQINKIITISLIEEAILKAEFCEGIQEVAQIVIENYEVDESPSDIGYGSSTNVIEVIVDYSFKNLSRQKSMIIKIPFTHPRFEFFEKN